MRDLRGLAVPIAVYLVITLGLPAAHGAIDRRFATHAMGVVAGCALVIAIAAACRLGRRMNNQTPSRVTKGPS